MRVVCEILLPFNTNIEEVMDILESSKGSEEELYLSIAEVIGKSIILSELEIYRQSRSALLLCTYASIDLGDNLSDGRAQKVHFRYIRLMPDWVFNLVKSSRAVIIDIENEDEGHIVSVDTLFWEPKDKYNRII